MLTETLSLIDKLKELLQIRQKRRDERFEEIFEPLFQEVLIVHNDYRKLFVEVKEMLANFTKAQSESIGTALLMLQGMEKAKSAQYASRMQTAEEYIRFHRSHLEKAMDLIESRRLEHEPLRQKLIAFSKNREMFAHDTEVAFLESVNRYFHPYYHIPRCPRGSDRAPTPATHLIRIIDNEIRRTLHDVAEVESAYVSAEYAVKAEFNHITGEWEKVCEYYASLKLSIRK